MKKIVLTLICCAFFAGENRAQYSGYSSKEFMADWSYNDPATYSSYRKGSTLKGFGLGMIIGGGVAMIVGIATADKTTTSNGLSTQVNLSGTGGAVFAAGTVCAVAGIPLMIIGNVKRKNAKQAYLNEFGEIQTGSVSPEPRLELQTSPGGMGLAFVF